MATDRVILDCARIGDQGMAAIDRIARTRLAARRGGRQLVLRNPSAELLELIKLSGLCACLGVEVQRKPE